jgi:hypothetical protein
VPDRDDSVALIPGNQRGTSIFEQSSPRSLHHHHLTAPAIYSPRYTLDIHYHQTTPTQYTYIHDGRDNVTP